MENTIYIGLSRQIALRQSMNTLANNIANMNTPGFKGQQMMFSEYIDRPDKKVQEPLSLVMDRAQFRVTEQGPLRFTGGTYDVALEGRGYFGIRGLGDEVMYTRAGNFTLDADGQMVTASGHFVLGAGGQPINIPAEENNITIDKAGNIYGAGGQIDQLMVMEFDNDQDLTATGFGLLKTDQVGQQAESTTVIQGSLEGSNVKGVQEMTHMIDVLRSYQSVQRMLQGEHDRLRSMIRGLSESG